MVGNTTHEASSYPKIIQIPWQKIYMQLYLYTSANNKRVLVGKVFRWGITATWRESRCVSSSAGVWNALSCNWIQRVFIGVFVAHPHAIASVNTSLCSPCIFLCLVLAGKSSCDHFLHFLTSFPGFYLGYQLDLIDGWCYAQGMHVLCCLHTYAPLYHTTFLYLVCN